MGGNTLSDKLMISVSGIRGIVGESIIPDAYLRYIMAYATMIGGGRIIVGSDTRVSKHLLRSLVHAGLQSVGCEIIDLGICPTPAVGMMIKELNADGGIAITASHNPVNWNALKFFSGRSTFINKEEFTRMMGIFEKEEFALVGYDKLKDVKNFSGGNLLYVRNVLSHVDVDLIRSKKFKVVADLCNGAGCFSIPDLLDQLGCDSIYCCATPNGIFKRPPEPLAENLHRLCELVQKTGADAGFAVDPDADRIAIVDNTGRMIGEERSCVLSAYHILKNKEKSDIAVNLSTTMAIDCLANMFDVKVHRTPIGEANVISSMVENELTIGGEGNGGVIYRPMHFGRDSATGIALMLELMAQENAPLTELNTRVPDYKMIKRKVKVPKVKIPGFLKEIEKAFQDKELLTMDGVKICFDKGWVHVRPSGTEPIVRIYAEAQSDALLDKYLEAVQQIVEKSI